MEAQLRELEARLAGLYSKHEKLQQDHSALQTEVGGGRGGGL